MHNMTDWNDFQYFLTVAMQGSLNAAAKQLGVNHSTVFRRINALEEKMAVRLFKRMKKRVCADRSWRSGARIG